MQVRAALLAESQPEQLGAGEGRLRERGREASGFAADASPGRSDEAAGPSSTGATKAATAQKHYVTGFRPISRLANGPFATWQTIPFAHARLMAFGGDDRAVAAAVVAA